MEGADHDANNLSINGNSPGGMGMGDESMMGGDEVAN